MPITIVEGGLFANLAQQPELLSNLLPAAVGGEEMAQTLALLFLLLRVISNDLY